MACITCLATVSVILRRVNCAKNDVITVKSSVNKMYNLVQHFRLIGYSAFALKLVKKNANFLLYTESCTLVFLTDL